jgi:hypothetical protein
MSDPDDPREFDSVARDRIRRKIRHYMTQHRIGVHHLARRIVAANPHRPEIPIKTLQRFLANAHRTNDMYVRFFHKFAEQLQDHDPVFELGRSLADLYGASDPLLGQTISRRYNVLVERDAIHSEVMIASEGRFERLREAVRGTDGLLYDGAMVVAGATQIAVLKDRLLDLPKTYVLRIGPDGLSGRSIHTDINGNQRFHQVRLVGQSQ